MAAPAPTKREDPQPLRPRRVAQEKKSKTHKRGPKKRGRGLAVNIVLYIFALIAIGALLYPTAANWFADRRHNSEISGYLSSVEKTPPAEREHKLDVAYLYNDELEVGPLFDPYLMDPATMEETSLYQAYLEVLRVSGTEAIGSLTYPRLGIGLPIYHGTSEEVLRKGVGHLYGTSMPVGGPGTHSVMTSHSGLWNANLFTDLPKAKVGDEFRINVLSEDHYYVVRNIETVLPEGVESLRIIEDEDWVTLFTCVPIGVNSHRILVQAERTEGPINPGGRHALDGDGVEAGFPWWILIFLASAAFLGWFLLVPPKKKKKKKDEGDSGRKLGEFVGAVQTGTLEHGENPKMGQDAADPPAPKS